MQDLAKYREQINNVDEELLKLLAKRFAVVEAVGKYKKMHGMAVVDRFREEEIIQKLIKKAAEHNISEDLVQTIWRAIFEESYKKEA